MSKIRYIVIGSESGLKGQISSLETGNSRLSDEFDVFYDAVSRGGADNCVYMNGGISVCNDFQKETEAVILQHTDSVIQFFSNRIEDVRIGSRWVGRGMWFNAVCYYMPGAVNRRLMAYFDSNDEAIRNSLRFDAWVGRFLAKEKIEYFNVCPNLVDLDCQSLTFGKERLSITITCETESSLPLTEIFAFQKGLKKRNQRQVNHIITSILQNGFSFPMFIWKDGNRNHCIDGHGRILALMELERRGYTLPNIPVVFIEADSEKEARKKLIELNSVNGEFSKQGLMDFLKNVDIDYEDLTIPGVDLSDIDSFFRVKYDPSTVVHQVTDADVLAAANELDHHNEEVAGNRDTNRQLKDIVCPKCQCEFSISAY